jgi:hypothetical protein
MSRNCLSGCLCVACVEEREIFFDSLCPIVECSCEVVDVYPIDFETEMEYIEEYSRHSMEAETIGLCLQIDYVYNTEVHERNCLRNRIMYWQCCYKQQNDVQFASQSAAWKSTSLLAPRKIRFLPASIWPQSHLLMSVSRLIGHCQRSQRILFFLQACFVSCITSFFRSFLLPYFLSLSGQFSRNLLSKCKRYAAAIERTGERLCE